MEALGKHEIWIMKNPFKSVFLKRFEVGTTFLSQNRSADHLTLVTFESKFIIFCLISLSKFNLPLIGTFTLPTPPGPYRATTCRGRELNYGSHTYFLTTQGHGEPPGWVISPMPWPPPRQHKHERQYTPSTHSVIPKREYGMMMTAKWYSGTLGGLKFPDIRLTGEEKPRKNVTQETCPDRGSNPSPLRDKRACYHLLHSGGLIIFLAYFNTSVYLYSILKELI